jgi:hypothetical protein
MRAGAVRKAAPASNKTLARLLISRSPCEISAAQFGLLTPRQLLQAGCDLAAQNVDVS